jgi:alkane 1-monooxygenase
MMKSSEHSLNISLQLSSLKYSLSLLPSLAAISGNLLGGYWTMANIGLIFVVLVLADVLFPDNKNLAGEEETLPDILLITSVFFHTAAVGTLLYGILSGILSGYYIWVAAVSTGLNSGMLGITAAHELVHRKEKWLQNLGIWNLFLVNYTHFYTEHRLTHHLKVGTPADPATARYGESLYKFYLRSIPGQFIDSMKTDARLEQRKGKRPYGLNNFTFRGVLLQILFMGFLFFLAGPVCFLAYLLQSVVAIHLLEYVNYIEHYGLVRNAGEKVSKEHSWQSDASTSRFSLFELSRHPDHHMLAYKPYHRLESIKQSPTLPFGYFGMFYLTIIPPLFFRIMNKRIESYNSNIEIEV